MVQSRNEERIQEDTRSVKTSLGSWSLEIQSLEREALNTHKKNTHTHTPPKPFEKSWRRSFRQMIDEKRQKITLSSWHPLRKLFWFHFQATISIPPMDHFHTSSPPLSAISDELLKSSFSDAWVRDYQIVNRYLQSQFVASKHPMQILQGTCTCSFPSPSNRSFVEFDLITGPWPSTNSPRSSHTALRIPAKSTFRLLPFTGILLDKKSNRSDLRISSQTPGMLGRNSWQGIASVLDEVRSTIYWINYGGNLPESIQSLIFVKKLRPTSSLRTLGMYLKA